MEKNICSTCTVFSTVSRRGADPSLNFVARGCTQCLSPIYTYIPWKDLASAPEMSILMSQLTSRAPSLRVVPADGNLAPHHLAAVLQPLSPAFTVEPLWEGDPTSCCAWLSRVWGTENPGGLVDTEVVKTIQDSCKKVTHCLDLGIPYLGGPDWSRQDCSATSMSSFYHFLFLLLPALILLLRPSLAARVKLGQPFHSSELHLGMAQWQVLTCAVAA